MDYSKIDNIEIDGIDTQDYPDFCDAYIVSADYNGVPMTEEERNTLNEDRDFVHEKVFDKLF
jgi:hypothetical protein